MIRKNDCHSSISVYIYFSKNIEIAFVRLRKHNFIISNLFIDRKMGSVLRSKDFRKI